MSWREFGYRLPIVGAVIGCGALSAFEFGILVHAARTGLYMGRHRNVALALEPQAFWDGVALTLVLALVPAAFAFYGACGLLWSRGETGRIDAYLRKRARETR